MAKLHKIRWRESDEQRLKKAVNNFNAKIRRIEKKNPTIKELLPEKVTAKDLKKMIETRNDLSREIKALQRFTKRGAETIVDIPNNKYNMKITKWEKQDMYLRARIANNRRKKRLKEIQETKVKDRGKETGYTVGELGMGSAELVSLSPLNVFTRDMSKKDLKRKQATLKEESSDAFWYNQDMETLNNLIRLSLEVFGDADDTQELIKEISNKDMDEFKQIFRENPGMFEFFYFPTKDKRDASLNRLLKIWS